jgi:hypothetical protein
MLKWTRCWNMKMPHYLLYSIRQEHCALIGVNWRTIKRTAWIIYIMSLNCFCLLQCSQKDSVRLEYTASWRRMAVMCGFWPRLLLSTVARLAKSRTALSVSILLWGRHNICSHITVIVFQCLVISCFSDMWWSCGLCTACSWRLSQ